ncbi:glycosyltransferase [Cryobacterium sp. ZS14-85]|uniref:Glycosyltransferase n=1 Tax=Cryobacterium zhongshanensis TaxID=2928153 RepID=A0AA41QUZ3_9MICO|nr:glycosyltransferase [Cryobacterium zhongshanensis]
MKIAHIVTYVSDDGAFGGPLTVAIGQAKELARRGHSVDIIAGWDGIAELAIPGVTVRLFPTRRVLPSGFSGLVSPALQSHVRRSLTTYDVVHIHLSRDLITVPVALAALRRSRRVILQTHGMVMPDSRLQARVLDAVAIRRVLHRASAVLYLTQREQQGVFTVSGGQAKLAGITNGIAALGPNTPSPISNLSNDVLFLARLHPRKRVMAFAEMARLMIGLGSSAHFSIVGPDEGDLAELSKFIAEHKLDSRLSYEGAIPPGAGAARLGQSSVYVLPSRGEVFPMTVLEALSVGTPVVIGNDCGIAPELQSRGAALVTDGSPKELSEAVSKILSEGELARDLIANGRRAVDEYFSISAVVDQLEALYNPQR